MNARAARAGLVAVILVVSGLLVAGCYTVLVHPQVETTGEDNSPRMCSDCHSSADYYYWHFPYQYGWYSGYPSYRHYYYDPWWWDNYWYWDDNNGHDGDHHDGGERAPEGHLWQPRVPPGSAESGPVIAPGTSSNTKDTNKSSGQGNQPGGEKEKSQNEGHMWQPRVPPQNPQPATPTNNPSSDKDEKKSEDKK